MEYYSSLDASQLDRELPTLFELISANQLESLLSPSLRYILVHYAQRYPQYLLKITNRFDELNLLLRSFIEWYFFKYWQGSFTENFYGLKRVSQTPLSKAKYNGSKLTQLVPSMIEERRKLSTLQTLVSIFEITGVAYLQEKLGYHYELLYSKYITNQLDDLNAADADKRKIRLQRLFVQTYPYVQALYRGANLVTTLMYMSGHSKSPSLLTFLFKINYSRLNQYDYSKNEPRLPSLKEKATSRIGPPTNIENILRFLTRYMLRPSWDSSKYLLGTFFPLAIFTLKFLEWWNNSDFAQKVAKSQGNALEDYIPSPAALGRLSELENKKKKIYRSGSTCPLCKEEISNPAIIETGYVFCYICIYNYLRDSHKIVAAHTKEAAELSDESEDEQDEKDEAEKEKPPVVDVNKGGRCPITGRKLLGCKWNELTGEYDVDGLRRLIF